MFYDIMKIFKGQYYFYLLYNFVLLLSAQSENSKTSQFFIMLTFAVLLYKLFGCNKGQGDYDN